MSKLIIIDYGMGNLNSVKKKLEHLKIEASISSNPNEIAVADKLILPGVGHFLKAVENIKTLQLWDLLNEEVIIKKKPILGICLGMQLMATFSEEGNVKGFGWLNAEIVKFQVNDKLSYKVPHMGWNQIRIVKNSLLMRNIPELSEFYFVHSFHIQCNNKVDILNESEYEYIFTSAVEKENIFGVQYHPEKSHDIGEQILKNFVVL